MDETIVDDKIHEGYSLQRLARYPFTTEARDYVSKLNLNLAGIVTHPIYSECVTQGRDRLISAMEKREIEDASPDKLSQELSILSYVIARIIAHHTKSKRIISRYASTEAKRSSGFFEKEDERFIREMAEELGLNAINNQLHYTDYLKSTSGLAKNDVRWRLVNRSLSKGLVRIDNPDKQIILRELVKKKIEEPIETSRIPDELKKIAEEIGNRYVAKPIETNIREMDESAIPPCIQSMLSGIEAGNVSHNRMFILATFFIGLGLGTDEIVKIFSRHPSFDEEKTRYQLQFLTGERGGTRYSCPSCVKIKSYGLCTAECDVKHPLNYYREMAKKPFRKGRKK